MKTCFRTLDNGAKPINLIHNELLNKQVTTNRTKLLSVAKTVLLCGRKNIPSQGHSVKVTRKFEAESQE